MYKRNQVEEAIAHVLEPESAKPSSEIRTRLKRLLDTDRGLGCNTRSADPENANFAFYSADAPGRGVEICFSDYETFALLTGLGLLRHGLPQGFAVAVLRRVRPELEKHHARILKQDPATQRIRQQARPGDLDFDNADPVFLVVTLRNREDRADSNTAGIYRGQGQLMGFIKAQGAGQAWTVFELGNSVHALASALAKTIPRKRGRGSQ